VDEHAQELKLSDIELQLHDAEQSRKLRPYNANKQL
jgi:hypothetical protein